jgi:hypothetical protein
MVRFAQAKWVYTNKFGTIGEILATNKIETMGDIEMLEPNP